MTGSSSGGIFLSYRRDDAAPYARLLQYQLSERFPDARVFMDLDSIEAGLWGRRHLDAGASGIAVREMGLHDRQPPANPGR